MTSDIPAGFDTPYRCKNHPERDAVAPVVWLHCQECAENAVNAYANAMVKKDQRERIEGRPRHGWSRFDDRSDTDRKPKMQEIEE